MFTGIIEALGTVTGVQPEGDNLLLEIASPLGPSLKIDQSVAHQGVCLTITGTDREIHRAVAIRETLLKSNLGSLKPGDRVNLERSLTLSQRLDGHLVQGHVDTTGTCLEAKEAEGSTEFRFGFPREFAAWIIEKGSIALNGISLTVFSVTDRAFSVAIIPYTLAHTTMGSLKPGDRVNLEFDLVGKYVARMHALSPASLI